MKPLHFVCCAALAIAALSSSVYADDAAGAQKKNVLLIISDDLTCALGCYGHPLVKSPSIDALAARGVRFEHAYCQFPLCNPSRCSFMSGRRPDTTKVYDNGINFRQNLPDVLTIPQHFMKAGYFAARVGKIYHYGVPAQIGTNGLDDGASWNKVVNPRGRDKDEEADVIQFTGKKAQLGASISWLQTGGNGEDHTDGKIATETIKLLEENKDRPFFIACGFFRPHVPCISSENYFALYPLDRIQLPVEPPEHIAGIPPVALTTSPLNYGLEPEKLRIFTRAYFASTSLMDAQTGRVMAALDRLNLSKNTVVVFIADHGWSLGNHGQWQKRLLFEESARVPMIICDPSGKNAGKTSSRTVELVDLLPTLTDMCGLGVPKDAEGFSLKPLVENPEAAWDHAAFTQVTRQKGVMGRSVRTERWRFSEWDHGAKGLELYDHQNDPHEFKNLATDPNFAKTVAELKSMLPR